MFPTKTQLTTIKDAEVERFVFHAEHRGTRYTTIRGNVVCNGAVLVEVDDINLFFNVSPQWLMGVLSALAYDIDVLQRNRGVVQLGVVVLISPKLVACHKLPSNELAQGMKDSGEWIPGIPHEIIHRYFNEVLSYRKSLQEVH